MEEFLSNPVAKALLTVASVDALVVLTVLQCRLLKEFFEKTIKQAKKCLFQHSEGITKIINVCKPSPTR